MAGGRPPMVPDRLPEPLAVALDVAGILGQTTPPVVDQRYDPSHTTGMKTAVSIPEKIFRSADSLAKRLGMSRSQLYATALADFLSRHQRRQVKERLDAIYGEEESVADGGIEQIQAKSLPPEEW
jgi:hypothetical protein